MKRVYKVTFTELPQTCETIYVVFFFSQTLGSVKRVYKVTFTGLPQTCETIYVVFFVSQALAYVVIFVSQGYLLHKPTNHSDSQV